MLGGFHFNDRRYADDDLTMGSGACWIAWIAVSTLWLVAAAAGLGALAPAQTEIITKEIAHFFILHCIVRQFCPAQGAS